nr:uncharacterized protein LOC125979367 isoform X2 [Syngnathus scovelli]XP_049593488.1 uncharacterized protein LOC125979367 isoform X2 [Syngnathus scovelli]
MFRRQKIRKASGPDGVSPSCLKVCTEQLAPIFARIFNRSLELCEVPSCFKSSTIVPVAKKPANTGDSPVKLLKYADDNTLIGLIQNGDETAYRQEVERLVHWCSQNHLSPQRLQVPGNHNLWEPEMDRPHRLCPEEGPAEALLPETAQEVQPAAGAAEDLLHCHHPVCPLHRHHCLVWIGLQTRQAQTAMDNKDCRKDNWNQPPIYPRLVPVQDQETCK